MIRTNVQPLIQCLMVLRTKCRDIIKTLVNFETADGMFEDDVALTDEQEAPVLADVQVKVDELLARPVDDIVEVLTADKLIEKE